MKNKALKLYTSVLALAFAAACQPTDKASSIEETQPKKTASFEYFSYSGQTPETVELADNQYQNPILAGYYPDPSVLRVDEDYYLVNSSFSHFPGIPVFHSKDLVNWSQIGNAIDRPDQLDFSGLTVSRGVFAPDISYHDGVFYIVTTCVDCKGNFVITADNPTGPWSDPVWLDFDGIDPSIFWEGEKAYIVNNDAPIGTPIYEGHRAIWVQEFDWQNLKMVGERTLLINGGVDITTEPVWIEGPHILKRDGYYYLTAAEGGTSVNHSQTIFRSKDVRGPFLPADHNPILTQRDLVPDRTHPISAAGHAKFVETQNGEWWATFLSTRPYDAEDHYNIGRETFLLPVSWNDGWPYILPAGEAIPFAHAKPNLPAQAAPALPLTGNFSYRDEFDGSALSQQWVGVRNPESAFYSIKNGALNLSCDYAFGDLSHAPSFIGRRQQHHIATTTTSLSYTPQANGDQAGLVAIQNDTSLVFFGIEKDENGTNIVVRTKDNSDNDTLLASAPITNLENIDLTLSSDAGLMQFEYAIEGAQTVLAQDIDATLLSTAKAGGFVGTIIGPYCHSSVQ